MRKIIISIFIVLMVLAGITSADPIIIAQPTPPPLPASITLAAVPTSVQADGSQFSTLIATVKDGNGQPSPGANVYFNTNLGTITTTYGLIGSGYLNITDSQGKAYAIIKSASAGIATATAATSGVPTATANVNFTNQDITPPVITNISNSTPTTNSVIITWNTDENANSRVKYGNSSGVYTNTAQSSSLVLFHSIGLTGLASFTTYYYVVNSTDGSGNSNQSNERSFRTSLVDTTPPGVTNPSANPNEILLQESGNADFAHMSTRLNVTVTDASGVAGVTIDLSSIGGSPMQIMTNIGGNIWSVVTNATGTPGNKSLQVNATDTNGNSNAAVNISLKVTRNGDVNGDSIVNLNDAVYLANHVLHVPGFEIIDELASDVDGSGIVNLNDAVYLANHVLHVPGFETLY